MERTVSAKVWLLLVCVVLLSGCKKPQIVSFNASPQEISAGESVTLSWQTSGATAVRLDPAIGAVDLTGSITLSPQQTTDYTLTASDAASPPAVVTSSVTVNVRQSRKVTIRALPETGYAPLSVKFSPIVETDSAINTYEWDAEGDGVINSTDVIGRDYPYTYRQPGNYTARVSATDSLGNVYTDEQIVRVLNSPPVVNVTPTAANGAAPISITFSVSASDNEGLATYEWDFDGDGIYDLARSTISTSQSASFSYATAGTYRAAVRVTDSQGQSTVVSNPAMVITIIGSGGPSVRLQPQTATTGNAPLSVTFNASSTLPNGAAITGWEWDFDGDGVANSTLAPPVAFSYINGGVYFPRVSISTSTGVTVSDVKRVVVNAVKTLAVSQSTINPSLGEVAAVNTQLSGNERVSVVIEDALGNLVQTIVPWQNRSSGTHSDSWDGRNSQGEVVPSGPYYAILLTGNEQSPVKLDMRLTTGGVESNPPRTLMNNAPFSPFDNQPAKTVFTLARPSEVTAFMGLLNTNVRLVTFYSRTPLGAGAHTVTWNGEDSNGKWIPGDTSNPFLFGVFAYSLADNAIYVNTSPTISELTVIPSILSPLSNTEDSDGVSHVRFNLSSAAGIELVVNQLESGKDIFHRTIQSMNAGAVELTWNGKADDGSYVPPGRYRIGVRATDALGNRSLFLYVLQRVYY